MQVMEIGKRGTRADFSLGFESLDIWATSYEFPRVPAFREAGI